MMISKNALHALAAASMCVMTMACTTTVSQPQSDVSAAVAEQQSATTGLKVVTWNVEHLAYPITQGCKPRTPEELEGLKAYAESLDADVVGLQEVGSAEAAALLFPADNWQIIMSQRPDSEPYTCRRTGFTSTQQKLAFAVRKEISVKQVNTLDAFGLNMPGLRHGLELTVKSDSGELTVLNLHMKSGCFVDNYSRADSEACQIFAKQAPLLDAWIEQKESSGTPYVVLGDFNHRLSAPYNHLTRQLVSNSDNSASSLNITTNQMIGCHPYYPAPIDHILVGNLSGDMTVGAAKPHPFENMNPREMLSDHCAVSLVMQPKQLPLTRAVEWQTVSKEYRYLTSSAYHSATKHLKGRELPQQPWVVVMDIDETVLDNSAYQVERDRTGTSFKYETWAEWVESEKATLVPGVAQFIDAVFKSGGRLALVTNRDRSLDKHTWTNLKALGIPVTSDNTCLIGRVDEDKKAIDEKTIINDKDLRRQQVTDGSASCYSEETGRHTNFGTNKIIMQVGDNIEDFAGVTQEHADVPKLVSESKGDLVLLPNPMYGSWQ